MFSGLRVRYEKKEFMDFQVKCASKYKKHTAILIGKQILVKISSFVLFQK